MSEEEKLCSVIVPAYNCERTIRLSIESALHQSYKYLELLIVDDCSTDNTGFILKDLARQDSRIRILFLDENGGVAQARNTLFAEAKGAYIAFLDSDDLWEPTKLEKQIELLEASGSDFVYSSYSFINGNSESIGVPKYVPFSCNLTDILKENFILCSSVVMRGVLGKQYQMDGSYSHEDMVYWLSLFQGGCKAVGHPEVLVKYRLYDKNRSGNKIKAAKDRWIVYRNFLKLGMFSSFGYFLLYATNGFRKYKRLR